MTEFLNFLLVLGAGLIFGNGLKRFNVPYVTSLIVGGVILKLLGLVTIDSTIKLLADVGLIFLMFTAGFEVDLKNKRKFDKPTFLLIILNSIIPFLTGYFLGVLFNYDTLTNVILGIIFISSSVAVIIPQLQESGFLKKRLGKTILSSTIIQDIVSLILISYILNIKTVNSLDTLSYFIILPASIFGLIIIVKQFNNVFKWLGGKKDKFETELRFFLIVLIASAIYFELVGVHPIVAGFLIGILLSSKVKHDKMIEKIRTLSYGLFIPIFFVVIGASLNLNLLFQELNNIFFVIFLVIALFVSKILSGFLAGYLSKFKKNESLYIGISTTPQLSTTLAVAFTALELGLLDNKIIASLITLSIVTSILTPYLLKKVGNTIR